MEDVNGNPAQARTGGPSIASTGSVKPSNKPDSQKSEAANPLGDKDYVEKGIPDAPRAGGPQPTDPVQNSEEE